MKEVSNENDLKEEDLQELFNSAYSGTSDKAVENVQTEVPTPEVKKEEDVKVEPEVNETQTPPEAQPAPKDWTEYLPEDLRPKVLGEIEKLHRRAQADSGRISSYARKMNDLEQELNRLKSSPQPQTPPTQQTVPKTAEQWEQLEKADPDLASAIKSLIEANKAEIRNEYEQKLSQTLTPLQAQQQAFEQQQYQSYVEQQKTMLTHPESPLYIEGLEGVVQSREFSDWIVTQPPLVQQTWASSLDARDVHYIVGNLFYQYAQQHYPDWVKAPEQAPQAPAASTQVADKIVQERKEKLSTPAPTNRSTGVKPVADPNAIDPTALFEKVYKEQIAGMRRA